jgi:hypothetical protein
MDVLKLAWINMNLLKKLNNQSPANLPGESGNRIRQNIMDMNH